MLLDRYNSFLVSDRKTSFLKICLYQSSHFTSLPLSKILAGREVLRDVQDRSDARYGIPLALTLVMIIAGGCSDRGDLGRHSPSLVSKTYSSSLAKAKALLRQDEDYDLPLSAAEDALRSRAQDLQSIRYGGVVSQIIRPKSGDGYARVSAITQDLKVERQRFSLFVVAARKVMQIDEARKSRLTGLDALTARQQSAIAKRRRAANDRLIRNGVRSMRERSDEYRLVVRRLPVERPQIPTEELQVAYEELREDVVQFHAEIDHHAHVRLGAKSAGSYK